MKPQALNGLIFNERNRQTVGMYQWGTGAHSVLDSDWLFHKYPKGGVLGAYYENNNIGTQLYIY